MPFAATWMDQEIIILSEVRKTTYDIIYLWNLNYDTNKHIYGTIMDIENRLAVVKGKTGWEKD